MKPPVIYFTVSMWRRVSHFEMLVENLREIWKQDPDIALHASDFCTEGFTDQQIQHYTETNPFHTQIWRIKHEFCNGMGHNVAARHAPDDCILAILPVDICMPPTICEEIRQHTVKGATHYAPQTMFEGKDGKKYSCHAAWITLGVFKSDFLRAGELAQNMLWGGNRRSDGGEDVALMKQLKRIGVRGVRTDPRKDLYCRWHTRNVDQTFYKSLGRYHHMPWWNKVDKRGNPICKPPEKT